MTEYQLKLNDDKAEALLFLLFFFLESLPPFPSAALLLLTLTTLPSLVLPGTSDSFSTQNFLRKSTSYKSVKLIILSLNALVQSAVVVFTEDTAKTLATSYTAQRYSAS